MITVTKNITNIHRGKTPIFAQNNVTMKQEKDIEFVQYVIKNSMFLCGMLKITCLSIVQKPVPTKNKRMGKFFIVLAVKVFIEKSLIFQKGR